MKRVETSRKLTELKELLQFDEKVLLIIHDNPDPDSVASAWAMELLLRSMKVQVDVAYGGSIGRAENRALLYNVDIDLRSIFTISAADYDLLLFLDCQPDSGNISFRLPEDKKIGIIDHHILNPNLGKIDFQDIREDFGATATIAYEYLLARNIKVETDLATALYYAIRTETEDLGRGVGKADREAYFKLHTKIDWDLLHRIVNSRVSPEYFRTMHKAIAGTCIYRNALVCSIGPIRHPDSVAEVADQMLRLENIEWVLCYAISKDQQMLFSLRSASPEFHMGELAQVIVAGIGTAGGHPQLAGGQVRDLDRFEGGAEEAGELLSKRFLRGINNSMKVGLPLVETHTE
ncbi:MAG: DHH family phosphoesterase [Candidatus Delongbacteria bacterium]|nr:DHH family phosphoesterase [Candidatus Delongbacteria bacterium]